MSNPNNAPGWPGIPARWTSSAKSGVGTAFNAASRVWFTLSHGIFNEIYYPRLDQACVRDMGLIVTNGTNFFSEEKRHCDHEIDYLAPAVPAYKLINTDQNGRYTITKEILADPQRDVVWQQTQFSPDGGNLGGYHLYVLLAPHLGNRGANNTAWIADYKGVPMLFAQRNDEVLALACSVPWLKRSAGFVGASDGWQDLSQHYQMAWTYDRAENGNVALTGEIDLVAGNGRFDLTLGFGLTADEAGHRARAALLGGFESAKQTTLDEWQTWQSSLPGDGEADSNENKLYRISTAVMRTHAGKRFPGGFIASLSIPWGFTKGDDDLGGYHLVWPRDLAETAGGLLAAGAQEDARRILEFLQITQEADGHWPQNMWLDGSPYWGGLQMDETAFPILLVDLARREGALTDKDRERFWPMIYRAAQFVVQHGPVSQQDRWEEDPGYSPFTLAVEIAALLVAADMAEERGYEDTAVYLRQTADTWNASIERWTYVTGTDLAQEAGVDGYYVRIAPPETADAASPTDGFVPIKNRPPGQSLEPAQHIVSPDALALVRFGLRAADDSRIINTVKVIDSLLKTETPTGPVWHRYNDDGYGEHENGDAFDGTGIGRAWPLLTGERGHYELAANNVQRAQELLAAMGSFANEGGFIPEQVWDANDISEKELFFGRPAGSSMPLVWAHAEYVKLCRSLADGAVFDMPPQTFKRYVVGKTESPYTVWRFSHKCRSIPAGQILRLELLEMAVVHWSDDSWQTIHDTHTRDTGLGLYVADLPTTEHEIGAEILFTFHWLDNGRWQNENFAVQVE
ncbi:MAG: glucan 1,4-alpha-glucosidase [Ardenticatenaceae bacterium]|nr:glucan 1,4-alpha-glucosidase [Ardenticatenaceae bacterium]MCB9445216.1 glucan 1,4-alpha-glucosidase [Ardenticatenaceae bacterium]